MPDTARTWTREMVLALPDDGNRYELFDGVLSPSTARYDRIVKRRRFQRSGIPEYWIVDLDSRVVERWRPDDERPEILDERLTWQPEKATEPLEIDLPTLFREVWGKEA